MKTTADIIIVGGGSAGCALAARLSHKYSILVLEAGDDRSKDPLITIPSNSAVVTNYYNSYFSQLGHMNPSSSDINPNLFSVMAGELLGGGTSVNGLQFVKGTKDYYDRWATEVNDQAWGAKNVSKVFKTIEHYHPLSKKSQPKSNKDRGSSGPVDVIPVTLFKSAAELFAHSVSTVANIPYGIDYNNWKTPIGSFVDWQVTETPQLTRVSSYTAYLKSVMVKSKKYSHFYKSKHTKNPIYIMTMAKVQRILFNQRHGKRPIATGVVAVVDGQCVTCSANCKVILTAGFQTASILQWSGIGHKKSLKNLGIDTIINNPNVGQHIMNHILIYLTGKVDGTNPNPFLPLPPNYNPQGLYIGGAQVASSMGTRAYELFGSGVSPFEVGVVPTSYTIGGLILDSKSEGYTHIQSSDPNRPPLYNFNYYSNPDDIRSAVDMYTIMYNTLVQMGLKPDGPDPVSQPNEVISTILSTPSQGFHWTGMTRMSSSAKTGVVDSSGRVFGSKNLYVADISVAPFNAAGNTQAVAYLVSNIIADKMINKSSTSSRH